MTTPTSAFETDFYQLTMSYAYLLTGKAYEVTGFECFYRHTKKEVSGDMNYVIFNSEKQVRSFMAKIEKEFKSKFFFDTFWEKIEPKLFFLSDEQKAENYNKAQTAFEFMQTKTFEYSVIPNGSKIYPKVPAFQFKGPKLIGQMIETPITNIINGEAGFETIFQRTAFADFERDSFEFIKLVMNNEIPEFYLNELKDKAKEYRNATNKIILEAGFRRAPSFEIAKAASLIAIEAGWNGTSNTALVGKIPLSMINGTMAHAFIMSFKTEVEAFKAWDSIFPNSVMLIDTYDTVNAVKTLIKENIKPKAVRIDSDPIEELAFSVRKELDNAGWNDVKIFLSGDITVEKLRQWEEEKVPYDMCMVGTKYVNLNVMEHVNCGFVYKVVELEELVQTDMTHYEDGSSRNYEIIKRYPVKKASGKSNYPGLKTVTVDSEGNILMTIEKDTFGYKGDFNSISNFAEVTFKEI